MSANFNKRIGVSLIVVVITIVIILIISGAAIYLTTKNAPIQQAELARFKNSLENYKDELASWISNEYINTNDMLDVTQVNATSTTGSYNNKTIKDIIPSMSTGDTSIFEIRQGKLVYIGTDLDIKIIASNSGIETPGFVRTRFACNYSKRSDWI